MIIIVKIVLLLLLLIISFAILFSKTFINEVIYLSIFSLIMALLYLVMKAPDVAITEASVGACITTLLMLWAAKVAKEKEEEQDTRKKLKHVLAFIVVFFTGGILLYALPDLPEFGSLNAPANNEVYRFYIENTKPEFGFPNVVTAILAGFRGYDTFGETIVIFTAAISILLLFNGLSNKQSK